MHPTTCYVSASKPQIMTPILANTGISGISYATECLRDYRAASLEPAHPGLGGGVGPPQ